MTTVYLYGLLGRKFGFRHRLEINSPAEAVRALIANRPDFEAHLLKHNLPGYQVFIGLDPVTGPHELGYPVGRAAIKIVPVVAGAKGGGIGVIIGVVLVAAAVVAFQPELLGFTPELLAVGGITGLTPLAAQVALSVGFMGASMVLGGVSQLLTGAPPSPSPFTFPSSSLSPSPAAQNKPSFFFNGVVNTTQQGIPVPLCYGRLRVGSAVISSGIFTEDIAV